LGRALVYHGAANGLSVVHDWAVLGSVFSAGSGFGSSVATAGDVNGDGFTDVIVGAHLYGSVEWGQACVYHGSSNGLSLTPNWLVDGDDGFGHFGQSVATAGDVNGDGYSDVIVGALNDGNVDEGSAVLYYGNGGDCLERIPRQARTNDSAPISILGVSDSETAFLVKALGRTSAGRGKIRLQIEVKPFGTPFNGAGLAIGDPLDTGAPAPGIGSAVALSNLAGGLVHHTPYKWRLRTLSDSPFFPRSPWFSPIGNGRTETDLRTWSVLTAVDDAPAIERETRLQPAAPNPFVASTQLRYALPERGRAQLAIYDVTGRKVSTLADEIHEAGAHTRSWDGRGAAGERAPSGVYFVRLEFAGRVESRKVVLTR
jgi:hypothetical protein